MLVKEGLPLLKCLMVKNLKMATLKITQIRSSIGRTKNQKLTLEALGLRKMNHSVEQQDTPNILGMVRVVDHLVKVEKI